MLEVVVLVLVVVLEVVVFPVAVLSVVSVLVVVLVEGTREREAHARPLIVIWRDSLDHGQTHGR